MVMQLNSLRFIIEVSINLALVSSFRMTIMHMRIICVQDKDDKQLVEGKVDWKGRSVNRNKHGGAKASFLILGKAL